MQFLWLTLGVVLLLMASLAIEPHAGLDRFSVLSVLPGSGISFWPGAALAPLLAAIIEKPFLLRSAITLRHPLAASIRANFVASIFVSCISVISPISLETAPNVFVFLGILALMTLLQSCLEWAYLGSKATGPIDLRPFLLANATSTAILSFCSLFAYLWQPTLQNVQKTTHILNLANFQGYLISAISVVSSAVYMTSFAYKVIIIGQPRRRGSQVLTNPLNAPSTDTSASAQSDAPTPAEKH
jgi:hypothetical protein